MAVPSAPMRAVQTVELTVFAKGSLMVVCSVGSWVDNWAPTMVARMAAQMESLRAAKKGNYWAAQRDFRSVAQMVR